MYSKWDKWYQRKDPNDPYIDFEREKILGDTTYFISATEPTNIQWENRHIKGVNYFGRLTAAILIVLLLLALSFTAIVVFKRQSIKSQEKFGEVDCDAVQGIFNGTIDIDGEAYPQL